MSNALHLYSNPASRGRIARWMLEEVGEPYTVEYLEYGSEMKSDAFRGINNMGKVPTLKHGQHIITEGAAICAYLADTFPDAGLSPTSNERADYYRWLFFAAGPVEAAVTNQTLGVTHDSERESMLGYGNLAQVIDTLELACQKNEYLAGDRFTAADVYAGSQIGFGMQFGTIEKRASFETYWARLTTRAAYQKANELDNAAMPASAD